MNDAKNIVRKLAEDGDDEPLRYLRQLPDQREVVLEVSLHFDVAVEDVDAVARNVFSALEHAVNTAGLSPENEEGVTTRIRIKTLRPRRTTPIDAKI